MDTPSRRLSSFARSGVTTLLAQWAERWHPRVAWVSADRRDNDPAVLMTYLAIALDRVEPIPPAVLRTLASHGSVIAVVPLLVSAIASMRQPVALILDHAEDITNRECIDTITELALTLPAGSRFAVASRDTVWLPAARLRAHGGIVEVGADDLAMVDAEAAALLSGAGVDVGARDINVLVQQTEGWPAGLYLAALAMRAGSTRARAGFSVTGDDRFVGDYLRSELLDRVSRAEATFLTRTSILDRMCGGLCDAVVGRAEIQPDARAAGETQSPGRPTRPPPRLVPLSPPVPGAAARRAQAARTGARPPAALRCGAVVRGERDARSRHRSRDRRR
jgi:LuxR family transcriptional regulator, maltose regulon positive regulatory protein